MLLLDKEKAKWKFLSIMISDFKKFGGIIDLAIGRDYEDGGEWIEISGKE